MTISRRNLIITGAVVGAGACGGVVASRLLRKRHAPSPYDDLLALLSDRDGAAQIGEAVLAERPGFDALKVAAALRQKLAGKKLADVAAADAASSTLIEAKGWVLPESVALLYALAAKAAA
jgi:hypothetical protein